MCCQNFDLVENKFKSSPRYCENIVNTEEKAATPKRQIRLKMAGIQSAENVQKTHEVLVSEGSTNSIAHSNGVIEDHGNRSACEILDTMTLCVCMRVAMVGKEILVLARILTRKIREYSNKTF